ncbi:MAG TPA: hypothetical protein VFD59_02605 [Nocardioidaceae bacterium]|nr:hypothetical protein [Nocardioidaceae bacterium]
MITHSLSPCSGFPPADRIIGLLVTVAILFVRKSAARDMSRRLMDGVEPDSSTPAEAALRMPRLPPYVVGGRLRMVAPQAAART